MIDRFSVSVLADLVPYVLMVLSSDIPIFLEPYVLFLFFPKYYFPKAMYPEPYILRLEWFPEFPQTHVLRALSSPVLIFLETYLLRA